MATAMTADATQMKDLHGTHAIREPRPETCPRSSRRRDETRGVNVVNNQGLDFCLVPQPKRVVYAFRAPRTDTAPPRTQSGDGSSRMIYCIIYAMRHLTRRFKARWALKHLVCATPTRLENTIDRVAAVYVNEPIGCATDRARSTFHIFDVRTSDGMHIAHISCHPHVLAPSYPDPVPHTPLTRRWAASDKPC